MVPDDTGAFVNDDDDDDVAAKLNPEDAGAVGASVPDAPGVGAVPKLNPPPPEGAGAGLLPNWNAINCV